MNQETFKNHWTNGLKGLFQLWNYVILISRSFVDLRIAVPPLLEEATSASLSPKRFFSKAKTEHISVPQTWDPKCSSSWEHPVERAGERGAEQNCHPQTSAAGAKASLSDPALCCCGLCSFISLQQRNSPCHFLGFWNRVPDLSWWGRSYLLPCRTERQLWLKWGKLNCSPKHLAPSGNDRNIFLNWFITLCNFFALDFPSSVFSFCPSHIP